MELTRCEDNLRNWRDVEEGIARRWRTVVENGITDDINMLMLLTRTIRDGVTRSGGARGEKERVAILH